VRRLADPNKSAEAPDQRAHPTDDLPDGPPHAKPPKNPKKYELVIDNDSGTYRPDKTLLPVLKKFLKSNFPDLHVVVKDCGDDDHVKMKKDQAEAKKKEGERRVYGQGSDSSISSSDEEELLEREREDQEEAEERGMTKKEKVIHGVADPKAAAREFLPTKHAHRNKEEADPGAEGYEADGEGVNKARRGSGSP
jgi:hypothetical protein